MIFKIIFYQSFVTLYLNSLKAQKLQKLITYHRNKSLEQMTDNQVFIHANPDDLLNQFDLF